MDISASNDIWIAENEVPFVILTLISQIQEGERPMILHWTAEKIDSRINHPPGLEVRQSVNSFDEIPPTL